MYRAVDATVEADGTVHLHQPIPAGPPRRAIVLLLDDAAVNETALLSEPALAEDWNRPEEDAAWSHLQPGK